MSFKLLNQGLMDAVGNSEGRLSYKVPAICGWGKKRGTGPMAHDWTVAAVAEGPDSILSTHMAAVTPVPSIWCPSLAPMGTVHM